VTEAVVVVPARWASTRFPGKVLHPLAGRPMLAWVVEAARSSGVGPVVVASEAPPVLEAARALGVEAVPTAPTHGCGSERVAEAVRRLGLGPETLVVNLQGDEPLMPPEYLRLVVERLAQEPDWGMATPAAPLHDASEYRSPHVVKVVTDLRARALYFSRAPIPWTRDAAGARPPPGGALRHLGLYAYRAEALGVWEESPPAPAEEAEKLEQLRALWAGVAIGVVPVPEPPSGPAVDTPEDAARVESVLASRAVGTRGRIS
jgi:3-deoxy-manno-octulosonate cytidylyltransferase (CMP-KDO synthetase)